MPDGDQLILKAIAIITGIIRPFGMADLTMKYF